MFEPAADAKTMAIVTGLGFVEFPPKLKEGNTVLYRRALDILRNVAELDESQRANRLFGIALALLTVSEVAPVEKREADKIVAFLDQEPTLKY